MAEIRALGPDDAALLRELRLRALSSDPDAFASAAAQEQQLPESEWISRAAPARDEGVVLIAMHGSATVGMAGVRWFDESHRIASLWGMWVDPAVRGTGAGRDLVAAAREWAAGHGGRFLRLGVLAAPGTRAGERDASSFYERLGFVLTGEQRPFTRDPSRLAFWMVRPV